MLIDPLESTQEVQLASTSCLRGNFAAVKVDAPSCERVEGSSYHKGKTFSVLLTVRENNCSCTFCLRDFSDLIFATASRVLMWMVVIPIAAFLLLVVLTIGMCYVLRKAKITRKYWDEPMDAVPLI